MIVPDNGIIAERGLYMYETGSRPHMACFPFLAAELPMRCIPPLEKWQKMQYSNNKYLF